MSVFTCPAVTTPFCDAVATYLPSPDRVTVADIPLRCGLEIGFKAMSRILHCRPDRPQTPRAQA